MWSKPDAIHSVDFALDVAKRTLEYYEDFFKVPYPLPKLGRLKTEKYYNWSFLTWLITSSGGGGGGENFGGSYKVFRKKAEGSVVAKIVYRGNLRKLTIS